MWYVVNSGGRYVKSVDYFSVHCTESRGLAFSFVCEADAWTFIDGLSAYFEESTLRDFLHVEFCDE